jgi:peptidoglycan/LPS O-acetylase OafA/YrhL
LDHKSSQINRPEGQFSKSKYSGAGELMVHAQIPQESSMSISKFATVKDTKQDAVPNGWMQHSTYQAQRYMPALDGLRGIAVALVITCHLHERMWNFLSGSVGVTIFFVLSGYLITRLALQEETNTGRLNVAAFYIRRTFRIFPLYYLILAVYAMLILRFQFWPAKIAPFRSNLPYFLSYLQEIPFWTVGSTPYSEIPFFHSWSLGIEEKFYLAWPVLMVGIARSRRDFRLVIVTIAALLCVIQGIVPVGRSTYHMEAYGFILFGVALALFLSNFNYYRMFVRMGKVASTVAFMIALITEFYLMPQTHLRGLSTLYALAMTVLIGALVSSFSIAGRILSNRGLILAGKLSYGIYLIHILCISAVEHIAKPGHGLVVGVLAYVGAFFLSMGVAYISHRSFEKPMIEMGRRLSDAFKRVSAIEANRVPNSYTQPGRKSPLLTGQAMASTRLLDQRPD